MQKENWDGLWHYLNEEIAIIVKVSLLFTLINLYPNLKFEHVILIIVYTQPSYVTFIHGMATPGHLFSCDIVFTIHVFLLKQGQTRVENLLTKYATVMVDEMRYGPFICAYGIKMHNNDFKYNPAVDRLLNSMLDLERRRESLSKDKAPKQKQKSIAGKKIPDELAMLLETTQVSKAMLTCVYLIYTVQVSIYV